MVRNIKVAYHTSKPLPKTSLRSSQLVSLKWDLGKYYEKYCSSRFIYSDWLPRVYEKG